jgi:hypothetical protein
MRLYCGIDWSERYHDVAVVDDAGALKAKRRIDDDPDGWRELLQLLADVGDSPDEPIPLPSRPPVDCWSAVCVPPAGPSTRQPARGSPLPQAA